jgi:hypothetical protein
MMFPAVETAAKVLFPGFPQVDAERSRQVSRARSRSTVFGKSACIKCGAPSARRHEGLDQCCSALSTRPGTAGTRRTANRLCGRASQRWCNLSPLDDRTLRAAYHRDVTSCEMTPTAAPPMTLGNAVAAKVRLVVWCRECSHNIDPDPAEMIDRYGAETAFRDWHARRFLRLSQSRRNVAPKGGRLLRIRTHTSMLCPPVHVGRELRRYGGTIWCSAEKSKSLQPVPRSELRLWNSSSSWQAPSTISKFATCTIPRSRRRPVVTASAACRLSSSTVDLPGAVPTKRL